MTGVTESYERQLWEELNVLLVEAIPDEASREEAQRTVLLAIIGMGYGTEIHDLYKRVRKLARRNRGYLRARMEEDNPVSAARRRLRLPMEAGKQA